LRLAAGEIKPTKGVIIMQRGEQLDLIDVHPEQSAKMLELAREISDYKRQIKRIKKKQAEAETELRRT